MGGSIGVKDEGGGRFYITATTNSAPAETPGTARKMWTKAAAEACGGEAYVEEDTGIYSYDHAPAFLGLRYIVTVMSGTAVCSEVDAEEQTVE